MINTLRFWVRLFSSAVALLLSIVFMIRMFAPGNAETAYAFKAIQPLQPFLDTACAFLTLPVTFLLEKLSGVIPATLKSWFPLASASAFFHLLGQWVLKIPRLGETAMGAQLRNADYEFLFPGVMDWRLLMALPVWGFVESVLLKSLIHVEAFFYRSYLRQRDAALWNSYRTEEPAVQPGGEVPQPLLFNEMVQGIRSEVGALAGANQDPLTGLYNRSAFDRALANEMRAAKLAHQHLALMMLDMDDFAQLNETYGQGMGDRVLAQVAEITNLQPSQGKAVAYRFADDEIAVILSDTSVLGAEQVAEWLRREISRLVFDEMLRLQVTASVGLYTACFVPTNGSHELDEAAFIAKADAQMYIAKRNGKNRVSSAALP